MEPLSKDEYKTLIARSDGVNDRHTREVERLNAEHTKSFAQYSLELAQGFNFCFYGYDSNRPIINAFAKSKCATRGSRSGDKRIHSLAAGENGKHFIQGLW